MRQQLALVLVASIAATASLVAAGTGSSAIAGCKAGMSTIGGKPARTFCGPAKATVHVGGKTFAFSGGSCVRTRNALTLQIGTVVLGASKQKISYFALDIGRYYGANPGTPSAAKDGTYTGGLVVVRPPGKAWDLNGADKGVKVTLKGNRTKGTFSGRTWFSPHTLVSGSFSCGN